MAPRFDFVSALILLGVFQTLVLSMIFLSRGMRSVPRITGISLLTLGMIETESFLNYSGYIANAPWFINISPVLILLLGPLNLLLAESIYSSSRSTRMRYLHFVPAMAFLGYSFFFFLQPAAFKIYAVMKSMHPEVVQTALHPLFTTDPLNIRGVVVVEGLALHLMFYSLITLAFVRRNEQNASRSVAAAVYRRWIKFCTLFNLVGSVIFMMTGGVINGYVIFPTLLPGFVIDLFCVMMAYAFMAFWVLKAQPTKVFKYSKSGLDEQFRNGKLATLIRIMDEQKPYRRQDFSLRQLAGLAGLTAHQASEVINAGKGMSFTELVNQYRIQEATRLLESSPADEVKVESLAYTLGYRSKSAFFTSFKRYTNTTPGQYRRLRTSSSR